MTAIGDSPASNGAPLSALDKDLENLSAIGRRRELLAVAGSDFTSNDYLGLADSEELREATREAVERQVPVGAGGSRLLRGNHAEHVALEEHAAAYFGAESALYFGGGYTANVTLFATAPQRGDLVVRDELVHASVIDGIRLGRAESVVARHNSAQSIDDAIVRWRTAGNTGRPWIAVESLYSMDGDAPDLGELHAVARRRDAILVIDEAHSTGVLGPGGRGCAATLEGSEDVVTLHTCGKALGTSGALICGATVLTQFLVNRGRPFIFATAPSPLLAAVTRAALALCEHAVARRRRLQDLVRYANDAHARHLRRPGPGSHVLPVLIGEDRVAAEIAVALRARGFDVRAIRPPTVPVGTARLRVAITLNVSESDIDALFAAIAGQLPR